MGGARSSMRMPSSTPPAPGCDSSSYIVPLAQLMSDLSVKVDFSSDLLSSRVHHGWPPWLMSGWTAEGLEIEPRGRGRSSHVLSLSFYIRYHTRRFMHMHIIKEYRGKSMVHVHVY